MTIQSRYPIPAEAGIHTETAGFARFTSQPPARLGTGLDALDWRSGRPWEPSTALSEPRRSHEETARGILTASGEQTPPERNAMESAHEHQR